MDKMIGDCQENMRNSTTVLKENYPTMYHALVTV